MGHRGSLIVVGTGIQWAGQTTLAARRAIEQADRVLFAVADPWAARWIQSVNPAAESLPYPRDAGPRRLIYREMVDRILGEVRAGRRVCAVFYGHPGVLADAAHESIRRCRDEGLPARMLPGVSALDCLFADLGVDPGVEGCQIFEATDFLIRRRTLDIHTPLVLCQIGMIGNQRVFDEADEQRIRRGLAVLAGALRRAYPDDHEVVVYEASTHPLRSPRIERLPLRALADAAMSEVSSLYVPPSGPAPLDLEWVERLGIGRADQEQPERAAPPVAPRRDETSRRTLE